MSKNCGEELIKFKFGSADRGEMGERRTDGWKDGRRERIKKKNPKMV
jgi:hypothetical protein